MFIILIPSLGTILCDCFLSAKTSLMHCRLPCIKAVMLFAARLSIVSRLISLKRWLEQLNDCCARCVRFLWKSFGNSITFWMCLQCSGELRAYQRRSQPTKKPSPEFSKGSKVPVTNQQLVQSATQTQTTQTSPKDVWGSLPGPRVQFCNKIDEDSVAPLVYRMKVMTHVEAVTN